MLLTNDAPSLTSALIVAALGYTPVTNARTITAGSGLSGGGSLAADRTISLALTGALVNTALGYTAQNAATANAQDVALVPATSPRNLVTAGANGVVPITLRAFNSSAYILELQSSVGVTVSCVTGDGGYRSLGKVIVGGIGNPSYDLDVRPTSGGRATVGIHGGSASSDYASMFFGELGASEANFVRFADANSTYPGQFWVQNIGKPIVLITTGNPDLMVDANGNLILFSGAQPSGAGYLSLADASTPPGTPASGLVIWVQAGMLYAKGTDGVAHALW